MIKKELFFLLLLFLTTVLIVSCRKSEDCRDLSELRIFIIDLDEVSYRIEFNKNEMIVEKGNGGLVEPIQLQRMIDNSSSDSKSEENPSGKNPQDSSSFYIDELISNYKDSPVYIMNYKRELRKSITLNTSLCVDVQKIIKLIAAQDDVLPCEDLKTMYYSGNYEFYRTLVLFVLKNKRIYILLKVYSGFSTSLKEIEDLFFKIISHSPIEIKFYLPKSKSTV